MEINEFKRLIDNIKKESNGKKVEMWANTESGTYDFIDYEPKNHSLVSLLVKNLYGTIFRMNISPRQIKSVGYKVHT